MKDSHNFYVAVSKPWQYNFTETSNCVVFIFFQILRFEIGGAAYLWMRLIHGRYAIIICVTGTFCMSINLWNVWGRNIGNNNYNNTNQSCHNVLVENIIICNPIIHKPCQPITTIQLIFCVKGRSGTRTCMFINLCNLWVKTSPIIIKTTTTKLAKMYW